MPKQTLSPRYEALMRYAQMLGFGDVHIKIDPTVELHAIIAIHSTKRGPAIGGCRLYHYESNELAMKDALRLSYMMTLKAAAVDLPHGGAKAVILKPTVVKNREALFQAFGKFVHEMNGRYVVATDLGTTTHDMDKIAEYTPYVVGAAGIDPAQSDPSPYTARGVCRGIQAAVQFKMKRDHLEGLRVAIQGAGKVAYYLARELYALGVQITITDVKPETARRFVEEFRAHIVPLETIYDVPCDIFAPCAIGGTINLDTLHRLKASIIAGAANNQLAHRKYGELAHKKGILYAPDFVINAGGLIQAAALYDYHDASKADPCIEQLYDRLLNLFERAHQTNKPTADMAELIAREKLSQENDLLVRCK